MTSKHPSIMVNLGEAGLKLAQRDQDIRGRTIVDKSGNSIGSVKALWLDEMDHKVRFLSAGYGGFLGLGEHVFLIPVESITQTEARKVHVDLTPDRVIDRPTYNPAVIQNLDYQESVYLHGGPRPARGRDEIGPVYPRYPHDIR